MLHHTSRHLLHRPSAFLAGAALLGACVLTAAPAQAATIGDVGRPFDTNFFAPANAQTTVSMQYRAEGTTEWTPTFPAGTYWVAEATSTYQLPIYAPELAEELGTESSAWSRVVLAEPGPIDVPVTLGAPGSSTDLALFAMEDGAEDPATLTEDEILDQLPKNQDGFLLVSDEAILTAASITDAVAESFPEVSEGAEIIRGDFLGIGADVTALRVGNIITVYGPDGDAVKRFPFGRATDTVLVGDWDGDGKDTFGMRRGNLLFLDDDLDGGWAEHTYTFGRAGDEVLVGDWDGDGKDTVAVRRGNTFYVTNAFVGGNAPISFTFGRATDGAYVADWDLDGKDSISVERVGAASSILFVKNTLTGGQADASYRVPPAEV